MQYCTGWVASPEPFPVVGWALGSRPSEPGSVVVRLWWQELHGSSIGDVIVVCAGPMGSVFRVPSPSRLILPRLSAAEFVVVNRSSNKLQLVVFYQSKGRSMSWISGRLGTGRSGRFVVEATHECLEIRVVEVGTGKIMLSQSFDDLESFLINSCTHLLYSNV